MQQYYTSLPNIIYFHDTEFLLSLQLPKNQEITDLPLP